MNKYYGDLNVARSEALYAVGRAHSAKYSAARSDAWAAATWAADSAAHSPGLAISTAASSDPVEVRFQVDLVMELL